MEYFVVFLILLDTDLNHVSLCVSNAFSAIS